jgi:hypothetical protein
MICGFRHHFLSSHIPCGPPFFYSLQTMVSLTRRLLASALITFSVIVPTVHPFNTGFPYETQKVRGVNLGGWLVLEASRPLAYSHDGLYNDASLSDGSSLHYSKQREIRPLLTNGPSARAKIGGKPRRLSSTIGTLGLTRLTLERLPLPGTFRFLSFHIDPSLITCIDSITYDSL